MDVASFKKLLDEILDGADAFLQSGTTGLNPIMLRVADMAVHGVRWLVDNTTIIDFIFSKLKGKGVI